MMADYSDKWILVSPETRLCKLGFSSTVSFPNPKPISFGIQVLAFSA
jgi:hypothetical protein